MFSISLLVPNAENTFDMDARPLEEEGHQLDAALKTGRISFVKGLYVLNPETKEFSVEVPKLLLLVDAIQETKYTNPIYTLSEGKALKVKPTAEVMEASKISHAVVWDHEKMGKERRVEGVVFGQVDDDEKGQFSITWQSMCFPFSNFGNGQNFGKRALDFVTIETLMRLTKKEVDWESVKTLLGLVLRSTEEVIQKLVKGLAALLMPAVLDTSVKASIQSFDANIKKLASIKVPAGVIAEEGISSFKASFELAAASEEGSQHSFKGEGLHEMPIFVDTLDELVKVANGYIFFLLSKPSVRESDSTIKALCNALHINPIFFGSVGNGTAYPLGALGDDIGTNTMANAVGNLLRCLTQKEDFKPLMKELFIKRNVRVGEVAAHVRGSAESPFYYIDNTFGGGFSNQLGPLMMTSFLEVAGKKVVFYNALGHGYSFAGNVLLEMAKNNDDGDEEIENAIGDGLVYIFDRIANASPSRST